MKLIFGADHAGYDLRVALANWARASGHQVDEVGALDDSAYDYPAASDAVVQDVLSNRADVGVICCGTGIGVSIRANRHPRVRAANCCTEEMARLARAHNHANILCLGGRLMDEVQAIKVLRAFLEGEESHEERHLRRVEMLDEGIL